MNNAERDEMLKSIDTTLDGVSKSVIRMEEHAHDPLTCPALSGHRGDHDRPLTDHKDSHGRHIRWIVWGVGIVATLIGGLIGLIKMVALANGG